MSKKIEDYLHLYLGCEARILGMTGKLVAIVGDRAELKGDNTNGIVGNKSDVKLFLLPLSGMSEEDFKECALLYWGYQNRDIIDNQIGEVKQIVELKMASKYGTAKPYVVFDKQGKEIMRGTLSKNELNPMQFQFLLSKGYDLFELIESGLAIDAAKPLTSMTSKE